MWMVQNAFNVNDLAMVWGLRLVNSSDRSPIHDFTFTARDI